MLDVCRLCLDDVGMDDLHSDSISYKTQIRCLMPEIDIAITPIFILCKRCSDSLLAAYTFKCECIRNEQLIKNYQEQLKTSMISNLRLVRNQVNNCDELPTENKIKIENCNDIDLTAPDINEIIDVKVICDKCRGVFSRDKTFEQHKKECGINKESKLVHKSEDNKHNNLEPVTYEKCNKAFNDGDIFQVHLKTHSEQSHQQRSDVSPFKNDCKKSNVNPQEHFCKICGKGFNDKKGLWGHREVHKPDDAQQCLLCHKTFKSLKRLKQHGINKHFGTFVCDTCGQKCGSNHSLVEHIRTHTGERPFKCEICGKGFAQRGTLTTHINCSHRNEKPFVCETCGKAFSTKGSLVKHRQTHIEYRERKYVCKIDGCDKSFPTPIRLHKHKRWHELPKKYQCTICDTAFKTGTGLRRHLRCHTGEKPYECSLCHKGFTQNGNLKIHLRSHRPKKKQNS